MRCDTNRRRQGPEQQPISATTKKSKRSNLQSSFRSPEWHSPMVPVGLWQPIPWPIWKTKHANLGQYSQNYAFDDVCSCYRTGIQCHPNCRVLDITWTTPATIEDELALLGLKTTSEFSQLPDTVNLVNGREERTSNYVHIRGDGSREIVHKVSRTVNNLEGINLLATCKQINEKGSRVLYSENLFVFNIVQNIYEEKDICEFAITDDLSSLADIVPGISRHGYRPIPFQESAAMKQLFTKKTRSIQQQDYVRQDVFLSFLNIIGMKNASFLKKLKIEDKFFPIEIDHRPQTYTVGIDDRLRTYTTILNRLECDIQSLTLDIYKGFKICALWELSILEDPDFTRRALPQEALMMLDYVVGNVVQQLPTLQHLQLGAYGSKFKLPQQFDEWGCVVRWMRFVRQRSSRKITPRPIEEIMREIEREASYYLASNAIASTTTKGDEPSTEKLPDEEQGRSLKDEKCHEPNESEDLIEFSDNGSIASSKVIDENTNDTTAVTEVENQMGRLGLGP
ncbi:hypothetical protein HYALB_00000491 [Hymenoscyphus albidus]|uniref:Uncharacterized protein n=1 Tax=Hymenoscyphus albidus TaxID=595503 RepID=A0A9N9LLS4_9HELO|nr:hypothetical protein HYALB_00000491 [Hymenoscyphus albidus]